MSNYDRSFVQSDWLHARRKLLYQEVVCHIKACSVDLFSFGEIKETLGLRQKVYRGLQEVPVDRIRGSVGRYKDFSSAFLPRSKHLRDRWLGVDLAMLEGKTPPVDLYLVGEVYFVLDGNHRVSVARESGYETIEAEVWEFPTPLAIKDEKFLNQELIKSEQEAFLQQAGQENQEIAGQIAFTCPGSYEELSEQIEMYRNGLEKNDSGFPSFEEAFQPWYDEVYIPSLEAIGKIDVLSIFPGRTEADLFIWAWQNGLKIEALETEDRAESDNS